VIVGTPVSAPQAAPQTEPALDDVPEDSLPEVEPLSPATYPPEEPVVPKPKKGSWLLKTFLFLLLAGAACFAAWQFYPELFDFIKGETEKADVTTPEPGDSQPSSKLEGEPTPETPEVPTEVTPEETPETKPEEPPAPEEPEEKVAEKKKRLKKRKPKETARVIADKMSVSEAKRQIRRMLASKQLKEAQKMLAEWVKKKPRDAGLRYLYGRLYLMLGKKNQAVDQLEEAIDLAPRMASAYHDLGAVYLQMGDNESACDALGQFVRLKPDHSRAPAIRDLMKKIKCP
jgi:tetratricopeptide (TPR) repeat protein